MDDINKLIDNKFEIIGLEKFAVIIGLNPSKTARSPILWNAAFKANNLNFSMIPIDVKKKNLDMVLEILNKSNKFIGGSVTIPYKSDVANILGENLTEEAKNIGAINCIFKNEKNVIMGTNTDGEASLISYKKNFGDINNKSILLLGLGGAGKAVLNYFLKEITQGKMHVSTVNESKYKFYENFKNINFIKWNEKSEILDKIDILINCTSLGFDNNIEKSPLKIEELSKLKKTTIVYDIIYNPKKTKLLKLSEELGLKTLNGLQMNFLQAVIAFNYAVKLNNNDVTEQAMKGIK
tara:strand:- start:346 stop:1227 length:882 start_codon:yes stop_codon:yes gene_type:complete